MTRHCNLAAGLLLLAAAAGCSPPAPGQPPVLMISLDTVRADALSCYGGAPADTPGLDRLASEAIRFERVLASSPNTAPSHATLFTGLAPFTHRVANVASATRGTPALAPAFVTLAERFAQAGYETVALTDDGPLGRNWNLLAGFEKQRIRYQDIEHKVAAASRYLEDRDDERPPFLFLHTYQAHQPYLPPLEFEQRFAGDYAGPLATIVADLRATRTGDLDNTGRALLAGRKSFSPEDVAYLRALYLAEVAYTDKMLGRWLDRLRTREDWPAWIVSVTADHGEEFGEHGHFGHSQLYEETLRVPWILRLGAGRLAGTVFPHEVGLVDVASTLLDAAGLAPTPGLPAHSLLPYVEADLAPDRPRYANTNEHLLIGDGLAFRASVRTDERALLQVRRDTGLETELFDRTSDPSESSSLAGAAADESTRAELDALARRLQSHLDEATALGALLTGSADLHLAGTDPEALRQMQALGYLDTED